MSWERDAAYWLDEPDTKLTTLGHFKERGHKFLQEWVDATTAAMKDEKKIAMQIGIGFEYDGETNAHNGAMLSIKFGEKEPTFFRPQEMEFMIAFLTREFDDAGDEVREFFDVESFTECLRDAIKESEQFSKEAPKQ